MGLQERTARIALSAPTGTQSGTFNVIASFADSVTTFDEMNISIAPDATNPGNGIEGVSWTVSGTGRNYNILFQIPDKAIGKFVINISGQVDLSGEMVDISGGLSLAISYDTETELSARFGDLVYRDGEIDLPITFNEDILYFHKTDAELRPIVGDLPYDFEVTLTEVEARKYLFTFVPPPNRRGAFQITLEGYVFRSTTSIRDNILVTPKLVPFNTYEIYVANIATPNTLSSGIWDAFIELSDPAIGVSKDDFVYGYEGTLPDGFIENALLYRAKSLDVKPSLPSQSVSFSTPPETIGEWVLESETTVVQGRYFIIRFNVPSSLNGQAIDITPKQRVFQTPVPGA